MDKNNTTTSVETGEFGPIYRQFEKKPKEAILFLKKHEKRGFDSPLYSNIRYRHNFGR